MSRLLTAALVAVAIGTSATAKADEFVSTRNLNCRAQANERGQVVKRIPPGTTVEVVGQHAGWHLVKGDPSCWSSAEFLKAVQPQASQAGGSGGTLLLLLLPLAAVAILILGLKTSRDRRNDARKLREQHERDSRAREAAMADERAVLEGKVARLASEREDLERRYREAHGLQVEGLQKAEDLSADNSALEAERLRIAEQYEALQGEYRLLAERQATLLGASADLATERRKRLQAEAELDLMKARLAGLSEVDHEEARIRASAEELKRGVEALRTEYAAKRKVFDELTEAVRVYEERLDLIEVGVYEPHFDFTDSEEYKVAIRANRARQQAMVAAKEAVTCRTQWTLDGSKSKGQTMTNRNIRLTLRAFNNECEAAVANVRWNNVNNVIKRVGLAAEQINKLNESNATRIEPDYLKLRLEEVLLTHEHRERLKMEKEERAEKARLAREEQRLLRDLEEAEDEEARYEEMLSRARNEASKAVGGQLDAYLAKIEGLQSELDKAHARAERARALAEQTRSGYVYVISNIGSFGEGVVKIGLTRRLDPLDRVRELGDASVPFTFDVHAIVYSDDAPSLERALHARFEGTRINGKNYRKEFFRANLDDVEEAIRALAPACAVLQRH